MANLCFITSVLYSLAMFGWTSAEKAFEDRMANLEEKESMDIERGQCSLFGKWRNELGSTMVITSCAHGKLSGRYESTVGQAVSYYELTGSYTFGKTLDTMELGWTVAWNNSEFGNSHSVTSWNGIYFLQTETIYTQWLLTRDVELDDRWASTYINHDEFKRVFVKNEL